MFQRQKQEAGLPSRILVLIAVDWLTEMERLLEEWTGEQVDE